MDYKVTKTTSMYIDAIRECDKLYGMVIDAVKEHYSGDLSVLEQGFTDTFDSMRVELFALLTRSINDNIAFTDSEGI